MASVAGEPSGVICSGNLGEGFRFGAVGFVTASTDDGSVELRGLYGAGIVGMLGQGPVASLASDHDMLAQLLLIGDVGVTSFAGVVTGECDGPSGHLAKRRAAIMAILPEAVRHDCGPQDDERHERDGNYCCQSNEVLDIFKQCVFLSPYRRV